MANTTYTTTLTTGKSWERLFSRKDAAGAALPFAETDTLRAQLREIPGGAKICDITAAFVSKAAGTGKLSLTDEQTALIPTASSFENFRTYYFDVDVVTTAGEIKELIVGAKLLVKAGATS